MSDRRLSNKHLCFVRAGLAVALLITLSFEVGWPQAARATSGGRVPATGLHEMNLAPDGLAERAWQAILERGEMSGSVAATTHYSELKLKPPSPSSAGNRFGAAVALSGDTLAVGACDDDVNGNNSGSVYVFERSGSSWSQQASLAPDDGDSEDRFGRAVALSGDTLVVGVYYDEDPNGDHAGSVYVFERGSGWAGGGANQAAKLAPDDGDSGDYFGYAVALSGDTLVVGAYYDDDAAGNAGAAYVFVRLYYDTYLPLVLRAFDQ